MWDEIERRMSKHKVKARETVPQFKARLRKTAMGIPEPVIRKMVESIKEIEVLFPATISSVSSVFIVFLGLPLGLAGVAAGADA